MVHRPSTREQIGQSIETRLQGRITKLTNFVESSFNRLFLDAFADVLYEYEVQLLAAQLSGWVEYAGGSVTEEDLERLGIEEFNDLELLNEHMEDSYLDNIGSLVGVSRSPGEPATGTVRIDTFDETTRVPDGLEVSTPPNFDGEVFVFEVDLGDEEFVTPSDQGNPDYVEVSVIATENGVEYNVGSGRIQNFRSPPPGVEGVTNLTATSGGEDEESNEELRERIQNAVFETSGGGTTAGIKGFIIGNVEGSNDVFVDEYLTATPVYVDVIVDGGTRSDLLDAIETSRPAGIRHNLVRPISHNIGIDLELRGTDIDELAVQDELEQYIFELDLGEDFIEDRAIQRIMNVEPDIENVLAFNTQIVKTQNQRIEYLSGTNQYDLPDAPLGLIEDERHLYTGHKDVYRLSVEPIDGSSVTITAVVNGTEQTLADSEYSVVDSNGNGMLDGIDFTTGSVTPDHDTMWSIDYDTKNSASETFTYEGGTTEFPLTYLPALAGDSTVTDAGGDTYTLGTDYDIIDTDDDDEKDTLKWLDSGSTPDESSNENFTVEYEVDVGSINNVEGTLNDSEHNFDEGVDFNELDSNADGYADQIDWSVGGDTPDDQTDFAVDYSVQRDIDEDFFVTEREKISPVEADITVTTYE